MSVADLMGLCEERVVVPSEWRPFRPVQRRERYPNTGDLTLASQCVRACV